MKIFGKPVKHTEANLVDLAAGPIGTEALGLACDHDTLGQPIVRLFPPPLRAADAKLALKLFYEAVLRSVLVHNDGSHLPAQVTISGHGMHVGSFLSAPNH